MEKERIEGYDNQKCFLIFLVVLGHFLEAHFKYHVPYMKSLFMWIYFFHMPAFIFLAGLFQKKSEKLNTRRVVSFIVIGFVSKLLVTITVGIFTGEYSFSLVRESGMPWFMFAMAAFLVLTHIMRDVKPVFAMIFVIAMGCAIGYDSYFDKGLLTMNRIIAYFPFYLLGYHLEPNKVMAFCKKKIVKICSLIFSIVYTYMMFGQIESMFQLRCVIIGRLPYDETILNNGGFLVRLLCYVIAMFAIVSLISLMPNRKIPIVTTIGKRTLAVYFWHRNAIRVLTYTGVSAFLISQASGSIWISVPVAIILTLLLGWRGWMVPINYLTKGMYRDKVS